MKTFIKELIPRPIFNLYSYMRETGRLSSVRRTPLFSERLRRLDGEELRRCFARSDFEREWEELADSLKRCGLWNLPRTTGSGDLRPLYFLARHFEWRTIIEIGTHVGSSTITLAYALSKLATGGEAPPPRIVTIDVLEVNGTERAPWRELGLPKPPEAMLGDLALETYVTFIHGRGDEYLRSSNDGYDFAFLDGDHLAASVYREMTLVSAQLNDAALIGLHDFASERMFSSYDNGWTIPGPYLAARRALNENGSIHAIPVDTHARSRWRERCCLALICRR